MCYPPASLPPVRPISGASLDVSDLVLTAADGNRFAAFHAAPASAAGVPGDEPGVVILPDVRGLHRFYQELASRFAEQGMAAVAIDYFGRTAGVSKRDDGFPFTDHVARTTFAGVRADTASAVEYLRRHNSERKVFTVGFCFGGSNSWHQAANGPGLSGAIGFYGHPNRERPEGAEPVVERVGDMTCAILALQAGDDPGIPGEEVERFREALAVTGVAHEVVVYPGAPHSFFDRRYEEFAEQSADAWRRVLAFIGAHS